MEMEAGKVLVPAPRSGRFGGAVEGLSGLRSRGRDKIDKILARVRNRGVGDPRQGRYLSDDCVKLSSLGHIV